MSLPLPRLDLLTYDNLVTEARDSIARNVPQWSDHNAHDPGITLIELLAWLVESDSYRLDRIPEEAYRIFLRLAGVVPKSAQVAETVLMLNLTNNATPLTLPSGLQIQTANESIIFQTSHAVFVSAAKITAVLSEADNQFIDLSLNNIKPKIFLPMGTVPKTGNSLYLGFDKKFATSSEEISLYCWTPTPEADRATRTQLIAEQAAAKERQLANCPVAEGADKKHYSAHIVWEYYAQPGKWMPLQVLVDETRAFTLSGAIRFMAPNDQISGGIIGAANSNYFIRCRLVKGSYDCPPRILKIAINAVPAKHAADVTEINYLKERCNGHAMQKYVLSKAPVVAGSTKLKVLVNNIEDDKWHEALSWDGIGPHSRTYVLQAEAGEIQFGNGRTGRVPPSNSQIEAEYQVGGGVAGNVNAESINKWCENEINTNLVSNWNQVHPNIVLIQPFPAIGGAVAETINQAKARAFNKLNEVTRAVTLADFEIMALGTPGIPIARAHALAAYHPDMPAFTVPDNVSVVVLPPCPGNKPLPSAALLEEVRRYLEPRRLIATQIHVIAPHYTTITVEAHLGAQQGVDSKHLEKIAQQALDKFFHPLHGGPDGTGWPIGRAVYRSEVFALLQEIDGVAYVENLSLEKDDLSCDCNNIEICKHGLIASGAHRITLNNRSHCHG